MCKKVLINPETESFINDLKREYNNSIVKPYKKTRDVLEILMKKFVLYQKHNIQRVLLSLLYLVCYKQFSN